MKLFFVFLYLISNVNSELRKSWETEILKGRYKFSWIRLFKEYRKSKKSTNMNATFWFWWRLANAMYLSGNRNYKKVAKRINRDLISSFNVDIMLGAVIGDNPWINHFSNVVITNFAVIGDNVSIKQGVTIGVKNINGSHYSINIGNNVDIGANACIISDVINIGNNVTIGALALVLSDIPDNSIYINKITPVLLQKKL